MVLLLPYAAFTNKLLNPQAILLSHQFCKEIDSRSTACHQGDRQGVLRRWPRSQRSIKPEKPSSRLRCLGDSLGDETGNSLMLKQLTLCRFRHKMLILNGSVLWRGG